MNGNAVAKSANSEISGNSGRSFEMVRYKELGVQFTTSKLSVKELANIFHEAAQAHFDKSATGTIAGFAERLGQFGIGNGGRKVEFYTITDASPFAEFDDDKPTRAYGADFPYGGNIPTSLGIYIWDRQNVREVNLGASYPTIAKGVARGIVQYVLAAIHAHDNRIRATDLAS